MFVVRITLNPIVSALKSNRNKCVTTWYGLKLN